MEERVKIALIERHAGTQMRVAMSEVAIRDYQDKLLDGGDLDPIDVMYDGARFYPWDGHHRIEAYERAGRTEIPARVTHGTLEDAKWAAMSANQKHGVRRGRGDVENAVKQAILHPMGVGLSDRKLAEHVGASPTTVGKYRTEFRCGNGHLTGESQKEAHESGVQDGHLTGESEKMTVKSLSEVPPVEGKRIGKDGKLYPAKRATTLAEEAIRRNAACPQCGCTETEQDEDATFCANCRCPIESVTGPEPGAEKDAEVLPHPKKVKPATPCPECGSTEVVEDEDGRFCGECYCPLHEPEPEKTVEPEPEPEPEPAKPQDQFGNDWGDQAIEDLAASDVIRRHLNALNSIRRDWKKLQGDHARIARRLEFSALETAIGYVKSTLKELQPFCVCPVCAGLGCSFCYAHGWITEKQYNYVDSDKKYGAA